jgi:hypothetical protein
MKIAVYLDEVSNAIDNAMQWAIMSKISAHLPLAQLEIIDPIKIGKNIAIGKLLDQDYDVLITYNKTGTDLTVERQGKKCSVLSLIKRKHIAWLTEHPLTFYDQYIQSPCNRHFIFPNESHAFFAEKMGLVGSYSVQMFGSQSIANVPDHKERVYDVCIAAQWRGPAEANAFWKNSKGKTLEFFQDVLYLQDNIETRDTFTAFHTAAKNYGLPDSEIIKGANAMRALYWYARKKERINLVRDLAKSGLKIALIGGDAWKSVLPNYDNIHFVEPIQHDDLKDWYVKSKAVVTMNNFNGANERVFDAMAAGATLFSENAPSLLNILGNSQAIFYEPNKASERVEELTNVLNDHRAQDMAKMAQENFIKNHTWKHRGEYLNSIVEHFIEVANV